MKKEKAVRIWAMVERINRKLAANGQILMATRRMKTIQHFGDYYILDVSGNVVDTHTDPEKLARKLGVLKEEEQVEPKKGKKVEPKSKRTRPKS
jgi:ABC-type multidrug transport system ATPase subunit